MLSLIKKWFHKHKPEPRVIATGPDGMKFTKKTVFMTELTFWKCKCGAEGIEWDNIIHWEK